MRISDWSSDVCSSDLLECVHGAKQLDVDFPNFRMPGRQCPNIGNVCENIARGYACFAMKIGIWPCPQVEGITETITLEHLLPADVDGISRCNEIDCRRPGGIGRESCRARGCPNGAIWVVAVTVKKNKKK